MIETIKRSWEAKLAIVFFIIFTAFFIFTYPKDGNATFINYVFAGTYGLMAAFGGIWGLLIAKKWGGFKSVFGKAILFLSLGLLAEEFGQIVFTAYYFILKVEIPYPSLADAGFFGNIPLYIIGILFLAEASGAKLKFKSFNHRLQAIIIPLIMLIVGYFLFLQEYEFDWLNPLRVFLDFGYPLGQAIYISLALVTFLLAKSVLGGIMRNKIFFILLAFVFQFIADYNFLYQSSRGTWVNGAYGDYLYFVAYFVMTLALLQIGTAYNKLRQ